MKGPHRVRCIRSYTVEPNETSQDYADILRTLSDVLGCLPLVIRMMVARCDLLQERTPTHFFAVKMPGRGERGRHCPSTGLPFPKFFGI